MIMKKIIALFFTLVCFSWLIPFYAAAESNDFSSSQAEQIEEFQEEITDEIMGAADEDITDILEENGISVDKPQAINDISISSVIGRIISGFTEAIKEPLVMLGKIMAVTLLCVAAQSMAPEGAATTNVFKTLGLLSVITVMYDVLYTGLETVEASLERLSEFMISYIPIFSSITAVGGSVTSSGSYYAMTLIACQVIGVIASKVIMPFLSIILAISLVSAINPNLQFSGAAESIKKACQWILGGLTTLFVGLLSIQGMTGSAADSLVSRTAKFAASSFIPIIGGAVSEAYSTLYSSIGIIRTGVGTIGIIAILIIVLQPILTIVATKFVITIAQIISGIFNQRECCEFLKSTNAVLSIGLSVVICFSLIFIISTAVLMLMAMNIDI